jgi:iron-siderophore transport system substrate-binding protein
MTTALLEPPVDDGTRRDLLLAGAALALGFAACGDEDPQPSEPAQMRTVRDAYGTVKVPAEPQRVVAVDRGAVDIAVAVGIKPAGVSDEIEDFPYLAEQLKGVPFVGPPASPDFERILTLKPDLILGLDAYLEEGKAYARLSEIAPTFAARFGVGETWREFSEELAVGLGGEQVLARLFDDYDAKVAALREDLGDKLDTTVSIIRVDPAGGTAHMIYLAGMFCGNVVYNDVGLAVPPQLRKRAGDPATAWTDFERESIIEISREEFRLAEADTIFVWSHSDDVDEDLVQAVLDDPLFQQLDAVKAGRVHPTGTHWIQETITGASMMLDDLRNALV